MGTQLPLSQRDTAPTPNFRPISVAAKWLHGSRCHYWYEARPRTDKFDTIAWGEPFCKRSPTNCSCVCAECVHCINSVGLCICIHMESAAYSLMILSSTIESAGNVQLCLTSARGVCFLHYGSVLHQLCHKKPILVMRVRGQLADRTRTHQEMR